MTTDPLKLRDLASWHRKMAERAGSAVISDIRLRTAEALEAQAKEIERTVKLRKSGDQVIPDQQGRGGSRV